MLAVTIRHRGGVTHATSLDLSETGMAVWAEGDAPLGRVELLFELDTTPVHLVGHIARRFHSDGGAVWGIVFDSLGRAPLRVVERYIFSQRPLADAG